MSVRSIFEFRFSEHAREEGRRPANAVGNDMKVLEGYLDHEVIQDIIDPGHMMVSTRWGSREEAETVLLVYKNNDKIKRITELQPDRPKGFVGIVLEQSQLWSSI